MKNKKNGPIFVLEELFLSQKILFTLIGLLFIAHMIKEQIREAKPLIALLFIATVVYISEAAYYIYKTRFNKGVLTAYNPPFASIVFDGTIMTLIYYYTLESGINLYPLYIWFVVMSILRFSRFHYIFIASIATILYGGAIVAVGSIENLVNGQVLVNIGMLFVFSLIVATLLKELERLLNQVSYVQKEIEQKNCYLMDISRKDQMTDLLNHHTFFEKLNQLRVQSKATDESFCLAILDIDNFKKINDTYGHPAGDTILIGVAKCIQNTLRQADIAARYGGEEFGLIITNTSLEEGVLICERIRQRLAEKIFDINGIPVSITISGGICVSDSYQDVDDSTFVNDVDALLYQAKRSGKNKIVADIVIKNQLSVDMVVQRNHCALTNE